MFEINQKCILMKEIKSSTTRSEVLLCSVVQTMNKMTNLKAFVLKSFCTNILKNF